MAYKKGSGPDANYNFAEQRQPKKRMGATGFANMPDQPIMTGFAKKPEYRDGIINSFVAGIRDLSDLSENQK